MNNNDSDLLNKIFQRQVEIREDIQDIKVDIARNTKDLENHIRRTEQNEKSIELLEKRIIPMEELRYGWIGVGKTITLIAAVAAIVSAVIKVAHLF